jgi:diguanylate cyclase (GGDEF)-like protein
MVQLQQGIPATAESGPCGAAAAEGRPVIVADFERIQQWPERRDLMLTPGLKACWALPIFSADDRVVGTLTVCFEKVCTPSARERHLLELSARLAAIALEHHQLYDELVRQARHDTLTGLPNRSHLESQLKELLSQTDSAPSAAILWLDLDRFKEINDSLGHRIGDLLLQQVAKRLQASVPAENILARMGADEFAILAPSFSAAEQVESLAAAVLEAFHEPFRIEGYELYLSASLGWALYPEDAEDGAALLRNADAAMHHAKVRGRNCSQRFTQSIRESVLSRLETEANLRQALINREFELFYQPQMDLQARLRGMESLIRWRHPKNGLLSPASFIPVAEDVGLIVPIGAWVLQEACRQCAAWHKAGFLNVKVSVNVSALQFYYSDFADLVKQALESSGLDPRHLEIELTESVIMRNFEEAARQMERVRALGVSIAIDDFGTGYSSLSYLQNLPVDALKIDRSFLSRIDSQPTAAVVRAIAMLGHSLGLSVIAEGVETPEQLKVLADMNIDFAQGYLLGKPMEAQKALNVLRQTQRWS